MPFKYEKLLSPYQLNEHIWLKNRLTYPNSTHTQLQGPETWPAEPLINEIAQLCSSGASLLSFPHYGKGGGGSMPRRDLGDGSAQAHYPLFDYTDPAVQNYICQVAATAHMFGSKILVKLGPAWPAGYTYAGGDARSLFPAPDDPEITFPPRKDKPLTRQQMLERICPREKFPEVIQDLVDRAAKYKSFGFDGMNFRLDRFMDADTNLRTDEYGGEVENRVRICREIFMAVKKQLGPDFLIEIVLPGDQTHGMDGEMPHGYTPEEALRAVKSVEDYVDIVQLRDRGMQPYHNAALVTWEHHHQSLQYCRAFKEAGVRCAISANGGFIDPDDMLEAIENGDCDLISAGRLFVAEPQFTKKLFSYPDERPTPCIQCNLCHGIDRAPWLAYCAVNPRTGMEHRLPGILKKPWKQKKVAIIGGGPIGMRAACLASEAGHIVTLFEKNDYLGGKLKYADLYQSKWAIRRYREWLKDELVRRKVEVQLNCELSPDALRSKGFDAVIACTGSVAVRPDIPGADSEGVWTAEDVYMSRAELGQKIVIVGGGGVATDTAMHLAQIGKDVVILTRQDTLAKNEFVPTSGLHIHSERIVPELGYGGYVAAWSVYENLKPIYRASTTAVTPTGVTYVKDGKEETLSCDSVIVTGGYRERQQEAMAYVGCAPEFYLAGDVENTCNNLQEGNVSAFGKCSLL